MSDPTTLGSAGTSSTVSSLQITLTAGISVGDTVGVALVTGATLASAVTVTDDGSNTYSAASAYNSNGVGVYKTVATHAVSVGGKITISLTGTASTPYATAWKQAGGTWTVDGSVNDSGITTSNQSQPKTEPTIAGDTNVVVSAMFGSEGSAAPTVDSPYTLVGYSQGTGRGILVAFYDATTTGTASFDAHWAQAHVGQILGLNFAPPGLSLTGVRGATAQGVARYGTLAKVSATISSIAGKKTVLAQGTARFGQLSFDYLNDGGLALADVRYGVLDIAAATTPVTGIKGATGLATARFGALTTNTLGNLFIAGRKSAVGFADSRFGLISVIGVEITPVLTLSALADARAGFLLLHNRTPGVVTVRAENKGLVTIRIGS